MVDKSITFCNKFVYPYEALGNISISESYLENSKLFMKALNSVEKVYDEDESFDFTDINIYCGIHHRNIYFKS